MLYKLRKNVIAVKDKDVSIFIHVRSISIPGIPSYADVLTHKAQELSVIVDAIRKRGGGGFVFPDTPETAAVPIEETLKLLEEHEFVNSGRTPEELNEKENRT